MQAIFHCLIILAKYHENWLFGQLFGQTFGHPQQLFVYKQLFVSWTAVYVLVQNLIKMTIP